MGAPRNPPLLVISGPTASGKTAAALELAHRTPIEVISADSRQVFRGMDVGTSKPTAEQRRFVRHYGLDVVTPDQGFSAHAFVALARATIDDIRARGATPVLVGGTGFYIKALLEGAALGGVRPNADLRAELQELHAAVGVQALVRRLRALDPDRLAELDAKNPRRLMRAIEIAESDERQADSSPSLVAKVWGIWVAPSILNELIEQRVEHMYATGLLPETQRLLDAGYGLDLPSMSGIGYAEAAAHLAGTLALSEARDRTTVRTRQYARRQRTWLRHQLCVDWKPPEDIVDAVLAQVCAHPPSE